MKLLVALDLTDNSERIIKKSVEVAKKLSAEIILFHVADPEPEFLGFEYGPESSRKHLSDKIHRERNKLEKFAARFKNEDINITPISAQGPTAQTIVDEAKKLGCEMIVMGSHGRGPVYHLVVGSVSAGVLCTTEVPVIIIPTHKK